MRKRERISETKRKEEAGGSLKADRKGSVIIRKDILNKGRKRAAESEPKTVKKDKPEGNPVRKKKLILRV